MAISSGLLIYLHHHHACVIRYSSSAGIPSSFSCITHCVSNSFPSYFCRFFSFRHSLVSLTFILVSAYRFPFVYSFRSKTALCISDIVVFSILDTRRLTHSLRYSNSWLLWLCEWTTGTSSRGNGPLDRHPDYLLDYAIIANSTSRSARRYVLYQLLLYIYFLYEDHLFWFMNSENVAFQ